jgi:hypothetical protein
LVEALPNSYADLTLFSNLSADYDDYKISYNTNISILHQFELTTTCIHDKATEQHEYTDQEIEEFRNEGYIQEAVTQILAWATSDEGMMRS